MLEQWSLSPSHPLVQRIDERNERAKQRRLDNSLGLLGVRLGLNTLGLMAPDP
jgi:hypothetical protein